MSVLTWPGLHFTHLAEVSVSAAAYGGLLTPICTLPSGGRRWWEMEPGPRVLFDGGGFSLFLGWNLHVPACGHLCCLLRPCHHRHI